MIIGISTKKLTGKLAHGVRFYGFMDGIDASLGSVEIFARKSIIVSSRVCVYIICLCGVKRNTHVRGLLLALMPL